MKSKNFASELNDIIHKFMVYNLMQKITKDCFAKYIINFYFEEFNYGIDYESFSFLDKFNKYYFIRCFEKQPIPLNINIDYEIIKKYIPRRLILDKFIEDYFNDEIILFFIPLKKDISLSKNKDIIYLSNLNSNDKNMKIINLICIIPVNFYYNYKYMIKANYEYINELYFIYYDDNFNNIFNKKELYLNLI